MKDEEKEVQRLTGVSSVTPGEIPMACFTSDTSILKEGQIYLCRCELDGEPFYQMLPFADGKLSIFSDFCTIISFALLP